MYFNFLSIPVIFSGFFMLILSLYTVKYWHRNGVIFYSLNMLAGSIYAIFYALELSSVNINLGYAFYQLQYIGIPFIPAFTFLFALIFSEYRKNLSKLTPFIVLSFALLTSIIVFTSSKHSFFISEYKIIDNEISLVSVFNKGIWYWVHQIYSIVLLVFSFYLFFILWRDSRETARKQAALIFMTAFIPFIFYCLYLMGLIYKGIDPTPLTFLLSGILLYFGIVKFNLFKPVSLAKNILFDNIPDAVVVFDKNNRISEFNLAAKEKFNLHTGLIGKFLKEENTILNNFFTIASSNEVGKSYLEKVLQNNQNIYFEFSLIAVSDLQENVERKMLIVKDITQLRKIEETRREAEEKFRVIFEKAPLGIFYFDKNGILKFFNDLFVQVLGSDKEKLNNLNLSLLPNDVVRNAILSALKGKTAYYNGIYTSLTSGKEVPLRGIFTSVVNQNGEVEGGIGIVEDITERMKTEQKIASQNSELQKLLTEKDRLMSIIAHDLRGPFGSFLSLTRLLNEPEQQKNPENVKEFALHLNKSAESLYYLLENLLDWSLIQKGSDAYHPRFIDIYEIVFRACSLFFEEAKSKNIHLQNNISEGTIVFADENMIFSVIRNLISNSIKFTNSEGSVQINSNLSTPETNIISIEDNGKGMSSDILSKLFSLKTNISHQGTNGEKGTGLGLIICKEFLEKHNTTLYIESEENQGSKFSFALPVGKNQ